LAAGEHVQPLLVDGLTMAGPNVLKLDGHFTQSCQLARVTGGGPVTHRAEQLGVEFVRTIAQRGQESVPPDIDVAESLNRQHVGSLGERTLVSTD
jgi:hypothetical protein